MSTENPQPKGTESSNDESRSQLDLGLDFALAKFALFHDPNKNCYAKNKKTGLIWRLDSTLFRDYLSVIYYENQQRELRSVILK